MSTYRYVQNGLPRNVLFFLKFLKRLGMYHDLIFDEKEQANVNITKEEFEEKENEEYLKELKEKL